jgi:hypothetical protein
MSHAVQLTKPILTHKGEVAALELNELCRTRISGHGTALCGALEVRVEPFGARGAW